MKIQMKKTLYFLAILSLVSISLAAQQPTKEDQIQIAKLAAPEEMREGATVMGFDSDGTLMVLKKGTNNLICITDDPNKKGFNAACYHKDLEPFMSRGRVLKKDGKSPKEIFDIREKEAIAGSLKMPENPTTLHILYGPDAKFNGATRKMENAHYRYVVYIPFATASSSGLPTKPRAPGEPWIMDPGTHRAHIMITPPRK